MPAQTAAAAPGQPESEPGAPPSQPLSPSADANGMSLGRPLLVASKSEKSDLHVVGPHHDRDSLSRMVQHGTSWRQALSESKDKWRTFMETRLHLGAWSEA